MTRRTRCVYLAVLGLSACRIEPTPENYIDPPTVADGPASAVAAEIDRRIAEIAIALSAGDDARVEALLAMHPDGVVLGPGANERLTISGDVTGALSRLAGQRPMAARAVEIDVGPNGLVAWFGSEFVHLDASAGASESSAFRFTGVFLREGIEWRLVQGHLSRPTAAETPAQAAVRPGGG